MQAINDLLANAQLDEAITTLQTQLRNKPADANLRALLVEVLCLTGELERADDHLALLMKQNLQWATGAINLRQIVRAQHARAALQRGQLTDDVVGEHGPQLQALLAVNLHLSNGDITAASIAAEQLETQRPATVFRCGDIEGEIRDCDDTVNGFFEGLGADGKYYLWPWANIEHIEFHRAESPVELIWRRATVILTNSKQGEVFVPLTYAISNNPLQQLGRETDWVTHSDTLVTGLGQKLILIGDHAIALGDVLELSQVESESARHAG